MNDYLLLTSRINSSYANMTAAEMRIADYIKAHMDTVGDLSAAQLAELTQTSGATVVRFCKSCGFSGLTELKLSLKHEIMTHDGLFDVEISPSDSVSVIKQKVLNHHCGIVSGMASMWDEEQLEQAASALLNARQIVTSGSGTSRTMALMFHDCCLKLNIPCYFSSDLVDEVCHVGMLQPGDVFVGFTYTGRFRSTVENFRLAKEQNVTTIGILGVQGSPAAKYIDIPLFTGTPEREYYFGTQSNLIGDFTIIEVLFTILATRLGDLRDYTERRHRLIQHHRIPGKEK